MDGMTDVKWQDPPPDHRSGGHARVQELDAIAAEIRAHPGQWALVEEDSSPGNGAKYERRGLQVCYRKTATGGRGKDIYARYAPRTRRNM